ncbi:hypothetical protein KIW84_044599 [Lathyrus oleraceus]|uniref:Uncharacterized protein n=1 Tax=Pisum sativum TaxID=3888 RepID=A0A9D4XI81_PEA|nr:hypothetical protein KIW84_044599 [Pisum sativum]
MLSVVGQIEIRVGLMDAHRQLKSEELFNGISQVEEIGTEKGIFPKKKINKVIPNTCYCWNDPDYQYVDALNGIVDHSPKKNSSGQSLTTEAYYSTTSFGFAPTIASSPKEIRDGNNSMSALNPDRILNDPANLQSPLRISPTLVQVAGSSTGYVQLLGSNSCQKSIDSSASFVTAQMNSGNSSINTADCRYPQQASVPRRHGDIGPPKNLNGQYFDNRNPNICYSDEVFVGTLHNDRISFSRYPISQQTESYGTKNELPHGMPHAFSDSQLYPSGAKSIYYSQEGITPSFSLNRQQNRD